jgi:hypothetical protein
MGLDLKTAAIIPPEELDALSSAEDILAYAEGICANKFGVGAYSKPKNRPRDLSEIDKVDTLSNEDLGILHAQYTAWASFYNTQLAQIRAAREIADNRVKVIGAKKSIELFGRSKLAKTEVPLHVTADAYYQAAVVESLKLQAMRLILEAEYNVFDKQAAAISRLITLRIEDSAIHSRGNAVESRRKTGAPTRKGWGV